MFALNANLAVLVLALIYGPASYSTYRRAGMAIGPAVDRAVSHTLLLLVASFAWYLTLNALHLHWVSLAGFGLGMLTGLAVWLVKVVFQELWRRLVRSR